MFCSMFSGSPPCLLGQHGSCSSAQWSVKLLENMLQNIFLNLRPRLYIIVTNRLVHSVQGEGGPWEGGEAAEGGQEAAQGAQGGRGQGRQTQVRGWEGNLKRHEPLLYSWCLPVSVFESPIRQQQKWPKLFFSPLFGTPILYSGWVHPIPLIWTSDICFFRLYGPFWLVPNGMGFHIIGFFGYMTWISDKGFFWGYWGWFF